MAKRVGKFLLKWLISLGLLGFLLWKIDLPQLAIVLRGVNIWLYLFATGLFIFQQIVIAYCWQILLEAQHSHVPFIRVIQVHLIGSFLGTFMPSSIGMDLVRAYSLSRYMEKGVNAMSSMFVTRVIGFVVNFAIALMVAAPVAQMTGKNRLFWLVLVMTIAFVAGVWVLLHPRLVRSVEKLLARMRLGRFVAKLYEFQDSTRAFQRERKALLQVILLSVFFQTLGIYIIFLVGKSLGLTIALQYYFIYIPLITVITILPLSIAGIGVREGAFVFFFAQQGAEQATAFSLSLLVFAQWIGIALCGGLIYMFSGVVPKSTTGSVMNSNGVLRETSREEEKFR